MSQSTWKAYFTDDNPQNPNHADGIVHILDLHHISTENNTITGSGNHAYYGHFTINGSMSGSKYVFELKFQNRTLYCKTGTKGQVYEGSWGETSNGERFRKIKIWKVNEKIGWNGYFVQNSLVKDMHFEKLEFKNATIQGNGDDEHGQFQIIGTFVGNQIDFKKVYTTNNHVQWIYWGITNNNKIEGKWGTSKTQPEGVFELYLIHQ